MAGFPDHFARSTGWAKQFEAFVRVDIGHRCWRCCHRFDKEVSCAMEDVEAVFEDVKISHEGLCQSHAVLVGEKRGGFVVGVDV